MKPPSPRGFTMIELLIVMAVIAILAAITAPSFSQYLATQNLKGAANELFADLQFARSESVQRNAPVTVTVSSGGYTIASGGNTIKAASLSSGNQISSGAGSVITYDPVRATANAVTLGVSNSGVSGSLQIAVAVTGRPTVCSPSGAIKGFPAC